MSYISEMYLLLLNLLPAVKLKLSHITDPFILGATAAADVYV